MNRILPLILLLLMALPARAQWERIDTGYGLPPGYNTNLVVFDGTFLYATVVIAPPARMEVYRSADEGTTWSLVHTFAGVAGAAFLRIVDGRLAMGASNVLLFSDDRGETWSRHDRPFQVTGIAGESGSYLLLGGGAFRSSDGGSTWTETTGPTGIAAAFTHAVVAGGVFLASTNFGTVYRLPAGSNEWVQVTWDVVSIATGLWAVGERLFLKASLDSILSSDDGGQTWVKQSTANPFGFTMVEPDPSGSTWLLYSPVFSSEMFITRDQGGTATAIGAGYPVSSSFLCTSNFAATTNYFIGNAWACSITDLSRNGVYRYRFGASGTDTEESSLPRAVALNAAYPNPFNPSTNVSFSLGAPAHVRLAVYDPLGREVTVLVDGIRAAGEHSVRFEAGGLPTGLYVIRLRAGGQTHTGRAILMR